VRLPAHLGEGQIEGFPYVLMERLPGTDLGHVIRTLSDGHLRAIAAQVAQAQEIAAGLETAGRYGYAPSAAEAPFEQWPDVLQQHFDRSQSRVLAAGLFDPAVLEPVAQRLQALRPALVAQPATPFLHDTTTKNVIVDADGRFSGIVDVDDLCFGDPRYTPALTLAVLKGYGGPQSYVAHWMEAAGHADDAAFGLYVALFLIDLMAEHGQVFNGNETASTPEARAGLLRALADLAI
jgi:aminoglycoside phosphotransferase (APT) family kinase protein